MSHPKLANVANFSITEFPNPSGATAYRVSGTGKAGRLRKNFDTLEAAQVFCNAKNAEEIEGAAHSHRAVLTSLSEKERRAAEAGVALAAGRWPLMVVIEAGIEAMSVRAGSEPIAPLAEEWLALIQAEVSPRWYRDLLARVRYFVKSNPGVTTDKLSSELTRAWLDGLDVTPTTKRNYRGALHRWGGWLKERGKTKVNPFSDIRISATKISPEQAPLPAIFSPIQAEAYMRAVETPRCRPLLGWAALCLFGGLRPGAETPHRAWSDINFTTKEIKVMGRKRGTGLRIFRASDQLLAWLRVAKKDGAESPGYYSKRLRIAAMEWANGWLAARGEAPITWDEDILRHTHASIEACSGVSITKLAEQMGTSPGMIYSHYRHPLGPGAAKGYAKILPKS